MAFTPVESGVGGLLIGLSALVAYLVDGKIAGVAGIMGPCLRSAASCQKVEGAYLWKIIFLLGLVLGGLVHLVANRSFAFPHALEFSPLRYALAGVAIGFGTRTGRGCTSGHGICGLPRLSLRSWIAVPTFMACAAVTVAVTRHVLKVDSSTPWGVAELQWPPQWQFPVAALSVSAVLAASAFLLPGKIREVFSPFASGLIFALGLGCAGMTSQAKVLDFLDFGGTWDPSLAFVMGCGMAVSFPAMYLGEQPNKKPVNEKCNFEKPPKYGNYGTLVLGAVFFGLGWGLVGICPGPAIASFIPYAADGSGPGLSFSLCFLAIMVSWLVTDKVWTHLESNKSAAQTLKKPLI
eukprot:TRINITY_DN33103_c0_g1_i1.p1 TRINITY_DN33103_c0_g1~~TRINITY_DN33103_c0_g1_i1.p1  ORF type:complete len:350 (-),score=33.81 TRINITY_DN33103_c0_g1_i1:140-1189(-)